MKKSQKISKNTKKVVKGSAKKRGLTTVPLAQTTKRPSATFSFRLKHREFIATLDTSSSYAFDLNVTDETTFPWLSNVAPYFDQWRLWSLSFGLLTSLSATQAGTAAIAFDPNSTDTPPESISGLLQMAMKDTGPVWQSLALNVPKVHLDHSPGPVRFTNVSSSSDVHLRSIGQILVNSTTTSPVVGAFNLFVDYDVELFNPQPLPTVSSLPEDVLPMITLEPRQAGTNTNWACMLTKPQADFLASELADIPFVRMLDNGLDSCLQNDHVSLANRPIELGFKEPGEYLVEIADYLINPGDEGAGTTFPVLANYTKGITEVLYRVLGMSDGTSTTTSYGDTDYINTGLQLLFKVLPTTDPSWLPQTDTIFDSVPRLPSIALSMFDEALVSFSGHHLSALATDLTRNIGFNIVKSPRRRVEELGFYGWRSIKAPTELIPLFNLAHVAKEALRESKEMKRKCSTTTTTTTQNPITRVCRV